MRWNCDLAFAAMKVEHIMEAILMIGIANVHFQPWTTWCLGETVGGIIWQQQQNYISSLASAHPAHWYSENAMALYDSATVEKEQH